MHPAAHEPQQLLADCAIKQTRRSGPGGQHRNKVATAVTLTHRPTQVQAEASERRSAAENRRVALLRLRLNLALEVRGDFAQAPPSARWRARVRGGRLSIATRHDDFPSLLAEALDRLDDTGMDCQQAAEALSVTVSQFVKLLKREPRALEQVNVRRAALGMGRLK